jgi:hypothetical protein
MVKLNKFSQYGGSKSSLIMTNQSRLLGWNTEIPKPPSKKWDTHLLNVELFPIKEKRNDPRGYFIINPLICFK